MATFPRQTWNALTERGPIQVMYLPDRPASNRIAGESKRMLLALFAFLGGFLSLVGGTMLVGAPPSARTKRRLLESGVRAVLIVAAVGAMNLRVTAARSGGSTIRLPRLSEQAAPRNGLPRGGHGQAVEGGGSGQRDVRSRTAAEGIGSGRQRKSSHEAVDELDHPTVLALGCVVLSEATPAPQSPSRQAPAVDTHRYALIGTKGDFLLQTETDPNTKGVSVPRSWLVTPKDAEEEEGNFVSSFSYHRNVTSFDLGDGRIGIHVSSYEVQQDGSAQAAAGRDAFFVLEPGSGNLHAGLIDLGITKARERAGGVFRGVAFRFPPVRYQRRWAA